MTSYLLLLAPSANRVYAEQAPALAAAELRLLCPEVTAVAPVQVAGVDYLALEAPEQPALGTMSSRFALFRREGDLLAPVPVHVPDVLDDDLVSIPKYPGKTNEQLTRLLLNVTLAAVDRAPGPRRVLDPMCGRGTTLTTALTLGHDATGVEQDEKALDATAAFLKTYLRRKRLKHRADVTPVRRDGRKVGRRLDVEVTPAERTQTLSILSGDGRRSAELLGKRKFDAVVTDAPYGVVHGGHTGEGRERSPEALLREALPVWAGQLVGGGALGIAFNTLTLPRATLAAITRDAGLDVRDDGPWLDLAHRVDASIHRDVLVATRPT
ncbi:hypothetical protein GCM10011519_07670 [Marmoricola endophyticus]|uniref:Ribosomal RNA large subunit methyltransferase K/L-like methyltransferase domain-containing protein n=1 Tax=Marmoricola endophyticus TaxID=2040280 RepID=A0A917F1V0_9ACTN|nr:site-specific DNA-methyltransferase [Marmoricola endophyticus]GGF36601.1 hypothetical protein GCM10011519_07670 [Marmoricola endophyticus]